MNNQINKLAKSMANEMNNKLLELLKSVGFKYVEDPYDLNVTHRGDKYSLLIYQVKKFTKENNITIKQEKINSNMYYILRKDNKEICYFYTSTEYFVGDGYCCKGSTFVSDVIFY